MQNCPCVWPRTPHLPTPQHTCSQWGLCNTGPKRTPAFPPKQETRICRAVVFLLISCFAAPSPDYFLNFFLVPLRLDIPNQLFVCVHLETNCSGGAKRAKIDSLYFVHGAAVLWNNTFNSLKCAYPPMGHFGLGSAT